MPRFLRSGNFWAGVITGAIVGPYVMTRFAPNLKAKIPAQQ